ncbi:hypothetical protein [Acinetobacter sp. ANC 5600]|uniref:hypothetical protein n=1 Tax=Acinetobacter sp. ANC 5600 TaxID=1960940 RepID=UPI0009942F76|nr:hypothetical protein [Acinetobacter sp. ANC 5600]OOV83812.1 hypothetical protein B1201_00745 [Acinetobacter sp. ANC 5600]
MSALLPATKLNEVFALFGVPGLKDLKPFGSTGKIKASYKKAMLDLIPKEPIDAHTGLGAIYVYENNFDLALNEFKKAYEKSGFGLFESYHYANSLFIYGDQEEAVNIYLNLVKEHPNDKNVFNDAVKRFTDYCYVGHLNAALESSYCSKKLTEENNADIKDMYDVILMLNQFGVSTEYFRSLKNLMARAFYQFFTLPSEYEIFTNYDEIRQTFTLRLNIDSKLLEDPFEFISDINDYLQDQLIDFYKERNVKVGSNEDKIISYFGLQ